eukprot:COSAG06_NODE_2733_length_6369_cov_4.490878_12_plen_92_part_00
MRAGPLSASQTQLRSEATQIKRMSQSDVSDTARRGTAGFQSQQLAAASAGGGAAAAIQRQQEELLSRSSAAGDSLCRSSCQQKAAVASGLC